MAGLRIVAGAAYRWLAAAYAVCVVVQFFLAGAGAFGEQVGVALEDQTSWDPHRAFGFVALGFGSLLLLLVCLAWRPERIWLLSTFLLSLLAFVVQPVLAAAADDSRWVGALHGAVAAAILALSAWLALRAWGRDLRRAP